jgi:hypothetical protein
LAVAWTNPKTWSFGEILTSTDMNTYVRDNTDELRSNAADASFLTSGTLAKARLPAGTVLNVWTANKTDTQASSVASGASVAVSGLSVSGVSVSNASNHLLFLVTLGGVADSATSGQVGTGVWNGSSFLLLGDAAGSATRTTSATQTVGTSTEIYPVSMTFRHTPGSTSSFTYDVHVFNVNSITRTLYVNRPASTSTAVDAARPASSLVIMEVAG